MCDVTYVLFYFRTRNVVMQSFSTMLGKFAFVARGENRLWTTSEMLGGGDHKPNERTFPARNAWYDVLGEVSGGRRTRPWNGHTSPVGRMNRSDHG
jgi:hypothetical protein